MKSVMFGTVICQMRPAIVTVWGMSMDVMYSSEQREGQMALPRRIRSVGPGILERCV